MITYVPKGYDVYLDGEKVGEIRQDFMTSAEVKKNSHLEDGSIGWRYFPNTRTARGEWFFLLVDCQRSLEE